MSNEVDRIFAPASASLHQLLCDQVGGFEIPSYQRPYRWKPADLSRVFEDVVGGLGRLNGDPNAVTFLGALITISGASRHHPQAPRGSRQVIDGQQRLTSLLMMIVSCHQRLSDLHPRLHSGSDAEAGTAWVVDQIEETRKMLLDCLREQRATGDLLFRELPKCVRQMPDQWAIRSAHARYLSPIAHFLHSYLTCATQGTRFAPTIPTVLVLPEAPGSSRDDHELLWKRYGQIGSLLEDVQEAHEGAIGESIGLDFVLAENSQLMSALFEMEDADLISSLRSAVAETDGEPVDSPALKASLRVLLFSRFLLERVVLTVINATDESYAFDLFDSLNTTGEPLTAFETFVPLIVEAEGRDTYAESESAAHVSTVSRLLADEGNTQLQSARLVTSFLLADCGQKTSNRHNDQRRDLTRRYRAATTIGEKRAMTQQLADTAQSYLEVWSTGTLGVADGSGSELMLGEVERFCLKFLNQISHHIVVAPLSRYFAPMRSSRTSESAVEFSRVIRGICAFSVLWRAAYGGTAGIDAVYREVMSTGASLPGESVHGLARTNSLEDHEGIPLASVRALLAELRHLAATKKAVGFSSRDEWIRLAAPRGIYSEQPELARFLLLVSAHGAVPEGESGLTQDGMLNDAITLLRPDRLTDDRYRTIEHVAPVTPEGATWDSEIYADPETIHRLGNLTLTPLEDNASLGNRSWSSKRLLYRALSSASLQEMQEIVLAAADEGVVVTPDFFDMISDRRVQLPMLQAVARRSDDWTCAFIEERTRHLLTRAWMVLGDWLEYP